MKPISVLLLILGVLTAGCSATGDQLPSAKKETTGAKNVNLTKAKCPVMGGDVDEETLTNYKGAKLYFCCPPCSGVFKNNIAKYAVKANEQLVVTGQAKQRSCPISGEPVEAGAPALVVDGIKVLVGSETDLKELRTLDAARQREQVFGDKNFAKAFVVKGAASNAGASYTASTRQE